MSAGRKKIPRTVVHYSRFDPRKKLGGVERYALTLAEVFDEILYMTPKERDRELVMTKRLPVICDNHLVMDWPEHYPVIGFQHGVAAIKAEVTRSWTDRWLANRQKRAAGRPRTIWVGAAAWVADAFGEMYGNRSSTVIYNVCDLERFDGKRSGGDPRLVLHDARSEHKGRRLIEHLAGVLPDWRFEPLGCTPPEVPDRMRGAGAFVHLSRYEGNSFVCGEAMAMDLPCMFTDVGLMREHTTQDFDVYVTEAERVFASNAELEREARAFLASLADHEYHPRRWMLEHASIEQGIRGWQKVLSDFDALCASGV